MRKKSREANRKWTSFNVYSSVTCTKLQADVDFQGLPVAEVLHSHLDLTRSDLGAIHAQEDGGGNLEITCIKRNLMSKVLL